MSKMPELPTEIKVGPQTYQVVQHETSFGPQDDESSADSRDMIGQCSHSSSKIHITTGPGYSVHTIQDTLLHETLHAVYHKAGSDGWSRLVFNQAGRPFDLDEHIVGLSTAPLLQTLQDNPALLRYLTWQPPLRISVK